MASKIYRNKYMASKIHRNKYTALKIPPSKCMLWRRLMSKGKTRKKGQILSAGPNKYVLDRLKEEVDEEDMISKLPWEILVSIMCLLSTDEAARMSVLSRRWRKIWNTSIRIMPRLSFFLDRGWFPDIRPRDLEKKMRKRIIEVHQVLKLHKAHTLYEFSLITFELTSRDSHHINAWLNFAAEKHVKELRLKLTSLMLYDASFIADNFHFLRVLYLEGIYITEDIVHRLFSNSPFLERFFLLNSDKLHRLSIVSAPNLKYLYIERCRGLQHLQISSSVENLGTIEINGGVNFESVNVSAPNLSHIILGIQSQVFKFDAYVTLLNQIKRLSIDVYADMISAAFRQIPEFSKLAHLELIMDNCSKITPIRCLLDILRAAPILKTFSFQDNKLSGHPAKDNALEWLHVHIPKKVELDQNHACDYLKVVKFDNFAGCKYEVEVLLHLLEYAVSVEKIFIGLMDSSTWRDPEEWGHDYEDKFDNQYEELCIECAQQLKTQILQMHPNVDVIIA
ncbi:F-box/FBD/LRR-repeat protein At1g13570-like isoform X1 [Ziziphus jujuba]|uniref:F-box/FBD/LRR-repeat protein At1g13570-like isoform X1 n=2 Tax=Ziziphus jujuba TaxID=326968 RepID=A0ABM3ZTB0_ZIZJJ|nr:F-box/FBD/LRR-repeat protein At1g13570-like isoform X1 [Ziziphus jujuba]